MKNDRPCFDSSVFGETLRELREKEGLTREKFVEEFSFHTGEKELSINAIYLWEIGKKVPTFKHMDQIARFFGCSLDFLAYGCQEDNLIA